MGSYLMTTGFRTIIPMEAFDGGLNNRYEPTIIADNEAQSCANVIFTGLGGVETRQGFTVLNTGLVNSNACDGLFTAKYNNGNESLIAFFGSDAFVVSGTTFQTIPSAQGVFTTGAVVDAEMYQNKMFFGHGSTPYKYDGTDFTRHGVESPSLVADGNANVAAGNLIGDYNYKVSYVNSAVIEGDVSTGSVTIVATAGGESILVTGIAVPAQSFGIDAKYLYRTDQNSGLSGTYRFIASLAASITTYTDNIASSAAGDTAPTDNGKPPNYEFIVDHQERVFVNDSQNPQYLWYSEIGNPYTFKSTSFIKIADGDGEKITGLGVQGDSIIIFKESSIWALYMPDTAASGWLRIKTNSKYGCASNKSIVAYEDRLLFLGKSNGKISGFYSFQGLNTQPEAIATRVTTLYSESKSNKIESDVLAFDQSKSIDAAAINFDNKIWMAVTSTNVSTENDKVYQFDFITREGPTGDGSWVPFTGISANDFAIFDNKLYFATSTGTGFVYQLEDGTYTDNGSAIDSFYMTKEWDGGKSDQFFDKDYRTAKFTVETLGSWNMDITHIIDSDGTGTATNISLDPEGSTWNSMNWGSDTWGGGKTRKDVEIKLGRRVGKRISFKFSNKNTAGSAFKVVRGQIFYNRRGLR
jgi:hypothetical protein